MENLILKYYNTLSTLKSQQKNMQIIYNLQACYTNFNKEHTIKLLSDTLFNFSKEINLIAGMMNKPYIKTFENTDIVQEYEKAKKEDHDILLDVAYTIDCLIIIFAVRAGIATSISEVVSNLQAQDNY